MPLNRKRIRDVLVNIILTLVVLAGFGGIADAAYQSHVNGGLSAEVIKITKHEIVQNNRHHNATEKLDKRNAALSETIIKLEGQLLAQEQATTAIVSSHSAELAETQNLQAEFVAAEKQFIPAIESGQGDITQQLTEFNQRLDTIASQMTTLIAEEQSTTTPSG